MTKKYAKLGHYYLLNSFSCHQLDIRLVGKTFLQVVQILQKKKSHMHYKPMTLKRAQCTVEF